MFLIPRQFFMVFLFILHSIFKLCLGKKKSMISGKSKVFFNYIVGILELSESFSASGLRQLLFSTGVSLVGILVSWSL